MNGFQSDLGVLLPALPDTIEWFTMFWSSCAESVLAVEVDERVTGSLPRVPHEGLRPLGRFVAGVREFKLTRPIAERLRLVLLEDINDSRFDFPEAVVREIRTHDDCLWLVRPVDEPMMRRLVLQNLALHEEYLGCVGGLEACVEPLCDLLRSGERLRLELTSLPQGVLELTSDGKARRPLAAWRPSPTPPTSPA